MSRFSFVVDGDGSPIAAGQPVALFAAAGLDAPVSSVFPGSPFTGPDGEGFSANYLELAEAAECAARGLYPVTEDATEIPAGHFKSGETILVQGSRPVAANILDATPIEDFKAKARTDLAAARWAACQFFTYDGVLTQADGAIAVVTAKVVLLGLPGAPAEPFSFKLGDSEFREWTLPDLITFGAAIGTHIQTCFDLESAADAAIDAAADYDAVTAAATVAWPA